MRILWAWGQNADGMHWSSIAATVVVAVALGIPAVNAPPGAFAAIVGG